LGPGFRRDDDRYFFSFAQPSGPLFDPPNGRLGIRAASHLRAPLVALGHLFPAIPRCPVLPAGRQVAA